MDKIDCSSIKTVCPVMCVVLDYKRTYLTSFSIFQQDKQHTVK